MRRELPDAPRGSEAPGTGMRLAFVTDCSSHQRWMAMLLLHSAGRVGQGDPITWLRWGCEPDRTRSREDEVRLLRRVYPAASLLDVGGRGALAPLDDSAAAVLRRDITWIKPFAFQAFLASPEIPNGTAVAMLDADFIFLSRLRVDDLAERSIRTVGEDSAEGPARVEGLRGVVQHYACCRNAGAPYIFTAGAWRALLPAYASLAGRATGSWGEEQEAFATAAAGAGVGFSVFDHFMVSDLDAKEAEGWRWVEECLGAAEASGSSCGPAGPRAAGVGAPAPRLPTFLHMVRPVNPEGGKATWQFSKYQVPPGWGRPEGEGILDCDMPLLAEPPAGPAGKTSHGKDRLASWMLRSIVAGVNGMLADVKRLKCPKGHNRAKALKIEADWRNSLLSDPAAAAPGAGADPDFVARCALALNCSRGQAPE
mmetsp:Transcript_47836/g.127645  ORF Transcript_47836/g.127645 Transcript_47836/m.127645 type:complete len:425 (+) Transcript_47836:3-1277(+)